MLSSLEDLLRDKEHLSNDLQEEIRKLISMETEVRETTLSDQAEYFHLDVRNKAMELWMTLYPCHQEERRPQPKAIFSTVMKKGYQCEVDPDLIAKEIENYPKDEAREVLIGEGQPPRHSKDGRLEFHVQDPAELLQVIDETDRVDYRTHFRFVDVKKDQELVTVIAPSESLEGKNIFGESIPARVGKPAEVHPGKNITYLRDNGTLYASKDGCLLHHKGAFRIEEVFIVDGDLDMKTGNIETGTRVLIWGNVLPGFTVRSTQDIRIMGNVEGATVESSEGAVVIGGGIHGQRVGVVRASKGIRCKFAQLALLSTEGLVEVEDSLLHCTISCGNRLVVRGGRHAAITGGSIRIRRSIEAKVIGSPSEPHTDIVMGFDFKYEDQLHQLDRELQTAKKELEELRAQLDDIERLIKVYPKDSPEEHEQKRLLVELKKEEIHARVHIEETGAKVRVIEDKALLDEKSWIKVHGSVHGNTVVHMHNRHQKIESEIHGVTIELDPRQGTIDIPGEDE